MRIFLCLLVFASIWTGAVFADVSVHYDPPSAWVQVAEVSEHPPTPPAEVSHGYDFLLIDDQVQVRDQSIYSHYVMRVTNEGSLQEAARFTWNYDPAYEALTLHHLRLIRGGVVQDRLDRAAVKTIQRETDLDRHMLNGELTALLVLDDVRVGDVIDYAFTRRGWNPAFGGRYFARIGTGWSSPVRRQDFRLVAPAGRAPAHRSRGPGSSVPSRLSVDGDEVLVWMARGGVPVLPDKETPAWHAAYPAIEFSEFATWAEVARWAEPLYALPEVLPETVRAQAEALTRGLTREDERAVALLQFVQQEVRYLGMELGAGAYQPRPPADVLARRFGDCKDKALLFCALARAAGLTAYPALVHTSLRGHIADGLPSPLAFDHVIAAIRLADGGVRWADPTLTYQRGGLVWRGLPNYERALLIRPGTEALSPVTVLATAQTTVKMEETFTVSAFDRPATFHVRTASTGRSADSTRRYFAETTVEEIGKSYVNYYSSVYPGLTATQPPRFSEDTQHNLVYVDEYYTVPDLWKPAGGEGKLKAEFYPKPMLDYATRSEAPVRTSPLVVAYPAQAELRTTVKLPEDWTVTPEEQEFESAGFRGTIGIGGKGPVVVMTYRWEAKADHVAVPDVAAHVAAVKRYRDTLGYNLTYGKAKPAIGGATADQPVAAPQSFRINWLMVLVALVSVSVAIMGLRAWQARRPHEPPPLPRAGDESLVGLGGWLVLVAIGVTLSPFRLVFETVQSYRHGFDLDVWEAITTPGSAHYQLGLAPLYLCEVAANLILVVCASWMAVQFYRRHRFFPTLYIVTMSLSLAVQIADAVASAALLKTNDGSTVQTIGGLARTAVASAVWIPYMIRSRRVRLTFTR